MNPDNNLQNKIYELEQRLSKFEKDFAKHQHDNLDGTKTLRKNIELDVDQHLQVGLASQMTLPISGQGTTSEQITYSLAVGADKNGKGISNKVDSLQLNLKHQPRNTSLQSFITATRTPQVNQISGTTVATTAGGNTITINGYNFATDELAGGTINIYNSSGTFIDSKVIASNTSNVVTITATWLFTESNATFDIYSPVFLGSANTIFQRFYTQEGTAGGVTNGGQNGLLYMDATGDLYWRNKGGTSTKLN
jgi:hypothetical protein